MEFWAATIDSIHQDDDRRRRAEIHFTTKLGLTPAFVALFNQSGEAPDWSGKLISPPLGYLWAFDKYHMIISYQLHQNDYVHWIDGNTVITGIAHFADTYGSIDDGTKRAIEQILMNPETKFENIQEAITATCG